MTRWSAHKRAIGKRRGLDIAFRCRRTASDPTGMKVFRGYRLTVEGIDFIEYRIYEKLKRRWEFWLIAIPTVTGLIGALTGLLAVWRHLR